MGIKHVNYKATHHAPWLVYKQGPTPQQHMHATSHHGVCPTKKREEKKKEGIDQ